MEQFDVIAANSIFEYVKPDIQEVERLIRLQGLDSHPDLGKALDVLLSSGGKRLRPTITILAGKSLKADPKRILTMAASIELLHTATLVHDDLIDASLLRRGSPTLNSQWSAGATVLTGDFLFASAARLSSDSTSIEALKLFSQTLRTIVNGEISQMFTSRCKPGMDEYYNRIYAKTASLFETSAAVAGIIAEAGKQITESLSTFGREIGMAFQIVDDILDFTGDENVMGKPKGSDLRQGLITLPAQLFFEKFPTHPLVKKVLETGCLDDKNDIGQMVSDILKSDVIEQSYNIANDFIQKGNDALSPLPDNREKHMLISLAQSQVRRNY
jgi:geranylgeranyl pyrophosphate synthase